GARARGPPAGGARGAARAARALGGWGRGGVPAGSVPAGTPQAVPIQAVPAEAAPVQAAPAGAVPAQPSPPPAAKPAQTTEWQPPMWGGMDFFAWLRPVRRNGFAVHWTLIYVAVAITITSCFHTILRVVQDAIWGRQIRKTRLRKAPIFVLGHWRTGTTHLHDLLVLDERFTAPT